MKLRYLILRNPLTIFFVSSSFKVLELDLGSFASVKKFAKDLKTVAKKPLDRLVCNAAVYQPALQTVGDTFL